MNKENKNNILFGIGLLVICVGFHNAFFSEDDTSQISEIALLETSQVAVAKEVNESMFQSPTTLLAREVAKPESLEGVGMDAQFKMDQEGNLIPTIALRQLFDTYLSTLGEIELEEVIGLIQAEINQGLKEPARSDALALLKQYIDYKIALVEFESLYEIPSEGSPSRIAKMEAFQNDLRSLREGFFDLEEYDSFFALEDAQNNFMIEQMRINMNTDLSSEQKLSLLAQAEEEILPQEVVESRKRVQVFANLREQVKAVREGEGSESEVFALREATLGSEAATALKALDQQRAQWKDRLEDFAEQRQSILVSGLAEDDKEASVELLLAKSFAPNEHKRVRALMNDGRFN